jgi:hypothetical protein
MNRQHVNYDCRPVKSDCVCCYDFQNCSDFREIFDEWFYDAAIDRWLNEGGALCPRTDTA